MDSNKTFVILVVIGIVFIAYTILFPKQPEKTVTNEVKNEQIVTEKKEITNQVSTNGIDYEIIDNSSDKNVIIYKESDLTYEDKNIKVVFDQNDATIKHAIIKDSFLAPNNIGNNYDMVNGLDNKGALQLKFGQWNKDYSLANISGGKNKYDFERKGNDFIFSTKLTRKNDGMIITIKKIYKFIEGENLFKLDIELANNKNTSFSFDSSDVVYSLGWGPHLGEKASTIDKKYEKFDRKIQYDKISYLKNNNVTDLKSTKGGFFGFGSEILNYQSFPMNNNDGWIAAESQYFAVMIYPDDKTNINYFADYSNMKTKEYYCGFEKVTNKSVINSSYYIYVGPRIGSTLSKYNESNKNLFSVVNARFDKINNDIDKLIYNTLGNVLKYIYNIVKNYGIAIIFFTILLKLVLSPLVHKSMLSQEKMTLVQPKLKIIQEKYKDKPDMLNKEMMNLYKKEGINPLGGCLPLLLQMPILMAMYTLLDRMVELKGASFLFIQDLSMPDAIFIIDNLNLFGMKFFSFNIMPLIMTLVTIVSTILTPQTQTNKQAQIMMWSMPILFLFLLYNVAAGLVMYWTLMNILNMIQQLYIHYFRKKMIKTVK